MEGNQAHTPLARDIAKLPKKVIQQALKSLSLPLSTIGNKEKFANDLVKGLQDLFQKSNSFSVNIESVINSTCNSIKQVEINRLIRKYFRNQHEKTIRKSPTPTPKNLTTIENLNCSFKCMCQSLGCSFMDNLIECSDCHRCYHPRCLNIPQNQRFECPYCFAINMDPQNQVTQVLFCGFLSSESRVHRINFGYNFFPNHQNYNLEARCFRLDRKNNYYVTWPDCGDMKFNDLKIMQFKPLAQNSSLKKRKDDIKILDKKQLKNNNSILITEPYTYSNDYRVGHYNHFIMICLVKHHSNQRLFDHILQSISSPRNSLQQTNVDDSNQDIQMQKVYVQLKCPLSFQKINVPVKGRQCVHDTCVDLQSVVLFNKSSHRQWRCPICKKKSHQMVLNQKLYKIILQNSNLNLSGITFLRDGSHILSEYNLDDSDSQELQRNKHQIVICLSDDQQQIQECFQHPPQNRSISNKVFSKKKNDIELLQGKVPSESKQSHQQGDFDSCWSMMSPSDDPHLRALTIGHEQFDENFERHQSEQMKNQLNRVIAKQTQNREQFQKNPNIPEEQMDEEIEKPEFYQPNQTFNPSLQNNKVQSDPIDWHNQQQILKQKSSSKNTVSANQKNDNQENQNQKNDTIILQYLSRKPTLSQQKTAFSIQNLANGIALSQNVVEKSVVGDTKVVINIIDSDSETEEEKYERLVRDQMYSLQQLSLQRNILNSSATRSQHMIFKGIANRLFAGLAQ